MPKTITRYTVFISSPSDAVGEHVLAFKVVGEVSDELGAYDGFELVAADWQNNSYADSGDEPQQLINHQLVDDCDVVLAFFRERFGTPTASYGSGTEEEVERALAQGKRVGLFFWRPPAGYEADAAETRERERIDAFKRRVGGRALYKDYEGPDELEGLIRYCLTGLVFDLERGASRPAGPALSLRCIRQGSLRGDGVLAADDGLVARRVNYGRYDAALRKAYERACAIKLPRAPRDPDHVPSASELSEGMLKLFSTTPVEMDDDYRRVILEVLADMGIVPPDGFFNLGGLHVGMQSMYFRSEPTGTDEEVTKHGALLDLLRACVLRKGTRELASLYEGVPCLLFALRNDGGCPATHVRIELGLPKGTLCSEGDYPAPSDDFIDMLLYVEGDDEAFDALFSPDASSEYRPYDDPAVRAESGLRDFRPLDPRKYVSPGPFIERTPYDAEDFRDAVRFQIGDFDFATCQDGRVKLSLGFDRVQHNATYAFPAYVSMRCEIPGAIDYRIVCDELAEPVKGELRLDAKAMLLK